MKYPADYSPLFEDKFKSLIVVDLETTGMDSYRCEILTWSMSVVDYSTLQRKDLIELTFRPKNLQYWNYLAPDYVESMKKRKKPIKTAEDIHGISLSQSLYFDDKVTSTKRGLEFISDHCQGVPQILVCHAFDNFKTDRFLDVAFIMAHMEKMGLRWELYKHLRFFQSTESYFREARARGYYRKGSADLLSWKEGEEVEEGEDFKLNTLCKHYKIKLQHHNAQSDREACEALYRIARGLGEENEGTAVELGL